MTTTPITNMQTARCEHCNHSSLALLLLRPSPVAKAGPLVPPGAAAVADAGVLAQGLLPARAPTESRTVLRLLRAGFVHVYLPSPPPGVKPWHVWQVTDNGDLVAQSNPAFNPAMPSAVCCRKDHNVAGMRLLPLPQAHKLGTVWIAFSANLWNDKLRKDNAANPRVMKAVDLAGGCSANTFKPTAAELRAQVLECALPRLSVNGATDHDFPFANLFQEGESLAQTMVSAAARHPGTAGKELAVVLADPVGYATELNALRLRRHALALSEIEKPENAHPLNSSNALLGMKQSVLDANRLESFQQVSPIRTRTAFQQSSVQPGTEWRAFTPQERQVLVQAASRDNWVSHTLLSPYRQIFTGADLGRIVYADHDVRAKAWAKEQTEATWAPIASRYDEPARKRWVADFENRMQAQHYAPLARFEADWRCAAIDAQTYGYFVLHFDATDANAPSSPLSPGRIYALESQYIHTPAPVTAGSLRDDYVAMLDKPVSDDTAVVQRALVGNQQSLFATMQVLLTELHQQATGDSGDTGMRDKAYDFVKGLRAEFKALQKHSWLGDALCMFSVGQLSALSGAALAIAADSKTVAPSVARALTRLQALWGVQQAVELAMQGALSKGAPPVPVLIKMRVEVDEALALLRARDPSVPQISRNEVQRMRRGGTVQISVLTDTDALSATKGDVDALLKTPDAGTVSAGPAGTAAAAHAGSAAVLSKEQFLRLYAQQSKFGAQSARPVRQLLAQNAADLRAMTLTLDGRLAIGSIVAQGIGLVNGLTALSDAKTQKEVRDAWYGVYDSTAGTLGGLLELWAVAVGARTVAGVGADAAKKSLSLASLRFVATIAGVAGGAINAVGAFAKAEDQKAAGNYEVSQLYPYSGFAFTGTGATAGIAGVGVAADWIVARQVGGVVVQRAASAVAVKVGAQGTATFLTFTVPGWGLVLLGLGMIFQVGAILLTPTPLQKWAGRSYFGKGDDKFDKGDWKAEHAALMEAVSDGTQEARKADAPPPAQTIAEPVTP